MAHKDDKFTKDGKKIDWMPQRHQAPIIINTVLLMMV